MTVVNTWIYRVNADINVQLGSKGGQSPIAWNYNGLPSGLYGDNQGNIKGSVKEAGLYSFSASCGDATGQSASSYYTLNVQPGTLLKSTFLSIQPTTSSTSPTRMLASSTILTRSRASRSLPTVPSSMP